MKVDLKKIIEGMEFCDYDHIYFYNPNTNTIFCTNSFDSFDYKQEEINECELDKLIDESYCLPTKYEINEYNIMKDFANDVEDDEKRGMLCSALRGKGCFRRFKDCVYSLNLENKWFKFRDERYEKIAIEWCEHHKLDYTN